MSDCDDAATLARLLRSRRSVRDFADRELPLPLLDGILEDARWSPSWSNTQPYRVAVAAGALRDALREELLARYDAAMKARGGGIRGRLGAVLARSLPDGDFDTRMTYPADLAPRRRATGFGLYATLGIDRRDRAARDRQMRRNFEFFGAPVALFVFVHEALGAYSILDAGIFVQSILLAAHARGVGACAQGALATWAGPVRRAFDVPPAFKLICGISLGLPGDHPVNTYNPGRAPLSEMRIAPRRAP